MRSVQTVAAGMVMAACVLLSAGGCSSSPKLGEGAKATETLQESASMLQRGREQLDATIASMRALRGEELATLPSMFQSFEREVDRLEQVAGRIAATNKKMVREGERYFATWDRDIEQINNEDIRTRSAERKQIIADAFDDLEASYQTLSAEYAELISDLRDIRTALRLDLNAEGLQSVSGAMDSALRNAQDVANAAGEAAGAYEALGLRMSPTS